MVKSGSRKTITGRANSYRCRTIRGGQYQVDEELSQLGRTKSCKRRTITGRAKSGSCRTITGMA